MNFIDAGDINIAVHANIGFRFTADTRRLTQTLRKEYEGGLNNWTLYIGYQVLGPYIVLSDNML